MQQGRQQSEDPLKPRWPWEVVRSRRPHGPANQLRYAHTLWLTLSVVVLGVLLTVFAIPARTVEVGMLADVEAAKLEGFPQLPPERASAARTTKFIEEWNLRGPGSPTRQQVVALSMRVGTYRDDQSLLNLGIMFSLIGVQFISAIAFIRALNNLYALGFEFSDLSPAWLFASWFIPVVSFVLPWMAVAEIFSRLWSHPGEGGGPTRVRWSSVVAGVWGLSFIGLWLLNPVSVNWLLPSTDIDDWLTKIAWTERMMVWLPISTFITAAALLVVSVGQHRRYRLLDARAGAGR